MNEENTQFPRRLWNKKHWLQNATCHHADFLSESAVRGRPRVLRVLGIAGYLFIRNNAYYCIKGRFWSETSLNMR
ncbi:hypothetical protein COCON_G00026930 [Conger conger]|uniref:Uncharacterized protein n=1 Tax=Conger conger TaxID=82655 RepID=A0A9Q1I6U4_CONCO|nr:hypothetical protein COCON_G00026930 [Conger conger]